MVSSSDLSSEMDGVDEDVRDSGDIVVDVVRDGGID